MLSSQKESSWFSTIRPIKPMTVELGWLPSGTYIVQPKIDGIRAILRLMQKADGSFAFSLQTASGKQVRNLWLWNKAREWAIQLYYSCVESRDLLVLGLDGELIVPGESFQATSSLVMSGYKKGRIEFIIFDFVSGNITNSVRLSKLNTINFGCETRESMYDSFTVSLIRSETLNRKLSISKFLQEEMQRGGEGIILRNPSAKYLFGRSTSRSATMWRIKPLAQAEATIIGLFEGETNENQPYTDHFGRSKRSTASEGMIQNGQLGGFVVSCALFKEPFRIGTIEGMTQVERIRIWENRSKREYIGKLITFRYLAVGSTAKAPRQPIGVGFRDSSDLTDY